MRACRDLLVLLGREGPGIVGPTAPDPGRKLSAAIRTSGTTKKSGEPHQRRPDEERERPSPTEHRAAARALAISRPYSAWTRSHIAVHASRCSCGDGRREVGRLEDGRVVEAERLDQDRVVDGRHDLAVGAAVVEERDRVAAGRSRPA